MSLADAIKQSDAEKKTIKEAKEKHESRALESWSRVSSIIDSEIQNLRAGGVSVTYYSLQGLRFSSVINGHKVEFSLNALQKMVYNNPELDIEDEIEKILLNAYRSAIGLPVSESQS